MDDKNTKLIIMAIAAIVIVAAGFIIYKTFIVSPEKEKIGSFEDCAKAGYPVMESYPRQCKTPDGKTFVENIITPIETVPPEIISGEKSVLHKNKEFGFKLYYPEKSSVSSEGSEGFLRVDRNEAVGVFLPNTLFTGTNLVEAAVVIGVDPSAGALVKCGKESDAQEQSQGVENINGVDFYAFEAKGVAAGNLYESKVYRTEYRGSCYEIVEMLHSGNIGNYPTGTVKEFDKAKFSGYLEKIVGTFVFTENAGSGVFGTVALGPVCPVERVPSDPNCAPTPYQTDITITKEGFSKQIKSDYEGKFRTDLDPGIYKFSAKGGSTLPRCEPVSAEVKPKTFISLSIQCDTGIR